MELNPTLPDAAQDPFQHLYRDSDVEGMSDGFDERTAYGFIDGFDDPSMGWARYAQVHFVLCLFVLAVVNSRRSC